MKTLWRMRMQGNESDNTKKKIDYHGIGQRIRRYRRALDYSQETLAELVNISTTHLSHIETAATKLSLPVFITIAEALGVKTDDLLHDELENQTDLETAIIDILKASSPKRLKVYYHLLQTLDETIDI